jgi:hypothetical protein
VKDSNHVTGNPGQLPAWLHATPATPVTPVPAPEAPSPRRVTSEPACRRDPVPRGRLRLPGWVVIHLSGLPGDIGRAGRPTFDLAPGGVYRAARVAPDAGALLPHRFTLACDGGSRPSPIGGLFSVALSCGSPRLAVSQHPALRSPDLPRQVRAPNDAGTRLAATTQPTHSSRRFYRQLPAARAVSSWRRRA